MAQANNKKTTTKSTVKTTTKPAAKPTAKPAAKPAVKTNVKAAVKSVEKAALKTVSKLAAKAESKAQKVVSSVKKDGNSGKGQTVLLWILSIALIAAIAGGASMYKKLQKQIQDLHQQTQTVATVEEDIKPIYVFNLEKVVAASDLVAIQKDFEEQIFKLGDEVEKAKKKISGLKKSKVNEDFSDVYLKSLIMKRDELILNHEKEMAEISDHINKALAEVAKDKNAPAIFHFRSIAATTKYVIDVSDDVIAKVSDLLKKK